MNFKEKSFEYANEAIRLIISLATGVLAFTVTFSKDMSTNLLYDRTQIIWIWVSLLLTIFFGLWTGLAITGTLNELSEDPTSNKNIMSWNIRLPSIFTIVSFLAGMIQLIIFGLKNF